MGSTAFVFLLLALMAVAIWLGQLMVITTDPNQPVNVALFVFALFLGAGSFGALAAWLLWARRWKEPKGYIIAVRQGIWVGTLVALSAILLIWDLFSWLAAGAIVLVLGGLEALLLLQPDSAAKDGMDDAKEVKGKL